MELQINVIHLTRNFFANLLEDPYLKNKALNESSKSFIDTQIANYMELSKRTHSLIEHSLTRRSSNQNMEMFTKDVGTYMLDGFEPLINLEVHFPKDIRMFTQRNGENEYRYLAVLEGLEKKLVNRLVIFKMIGEKFEEINQILVANGIKLGILTMPKSTLIVVAENNTLPEYFHERTGVFEFTIEEELNKIQSLGSEYASDVALWEEHHQKFMTVSQSMTSYNGKITYKVQNPIYKWLGKHFDIIQHIVTFGVRKVTAFFIGSSHFLAVANFQDDNGNTNIYSEIFKYDRHFEKFRSYQKIFTRAAVDVKQFNFYADGVYESFLVFANMYDTEIDGKINSEVESIVYKYVQGYFIPFQSFKLNGATEWLPVNGPNGEFVLLVACKFDGIKAFQYDGWKFVESPVQYTHETFAQGVVSMHAYNWDEKSIVVISNENDHGTMTNIFQVNFNHQKQLKDIYSDMLLWCKDALHDIKSSMNVTQISKYVENAPKRGDKILDLTNKIFFNNNLTVENLEKSEFQFNKDVSDETKLQRLKMEVTELDEDLDSVQQQTQIILNLTNGNVLENDVHIKNLVINGSAFFESLHADTINDIHMINLLNNSINTNNDFIMEDLCEFENITVHSSIDFLLQYIKDQHLNNLTVNGDVYLEDGLIIKGKLNGINFTDDNILLNKGNQSFNNFDLNVLSATRFEVADTQPIIIENIVNLTVKNADIGGLINGVDIVKLEKIALKTFGDQTLTGKYTFDSLNVENINTTTLSDKKIPEDLVLINKGDYTVENDVEFSNNLTAKSILLTDSLNDIQVINGKLDVLLDNVTYIQQITGTKKFENVELLNRIEMRGKFNSKTKNKLNPVKIINEEVILNGDYVIKGEVKIEKLLKAKDLAGTNSKFSVSLLQEKGIRLNQTRIPVRLNFLQELNVEEVFTDKINEQFVNSLVVTGSNQSQIITGWKKFKGDVTVTGSTKLENVNGINVPDLEFSVFKTTGDQTLTGTYHFEKIIANRISNVRTMFGGNLWENIMTVQGDQQIKGTTIISNSLETKTLEAAAIHCNSLINNFDFNWLINDTLLRNQTGQIIEHKEFKHLMVDNLQVDKLDLNALPKLIEALKLTFEFDEDVSFVNDLMIENITFNDVFNDIPREEFGQQLLLNRKEQIIESDQSFNNLNIYGYLYVESGLINDVSMVNFVENSIKIDEPFHFESATFTNSLVSLTSVTLEGQFESLDLNDIVQSNAIDMQILTDEIIFKDNVTVFGQTHFSGLISGNNLTQLCEFALPLVKESPKNLHVFGNIYFAKGPKILNINNMPLHEIFNNVWFTNHDSLITGVIEFEEILFQKDIYVDGFVDDVKIQLLAQTYFSKTHDQNISAVLNFADNAVFAGGILAPRATVTGNVGGINLDEFMGTALLHDFPQVFENTIYLDECDIQDLQGEYMVNGLNLPTDVMRYDQHNFVTGRKVIRDVQTRTLKIEKNINVQNVDVLKWIHSVVLRFGTFEIPGPVTFMNQITFLSGISSQDTINGIKFDSDNIVLRSVSQTISGQKTFIDMHDQPHQFKSIELHGDLNNIDVDNLIKNQAYKNQDLLFESPIYLNGTLTTPNLNILGLYHGVNVSELIVNVTHFAFTTNYNENYQNLLHITYDIRDSLQGHAYFVDYYKVKQIFPTISIAFPLKFKDDNVQHIACIQNNNSGFRIEYYIWDKEAEYFIIDEGMPHISSLRTINYIKDISYKGKQHWYIENEVNIWNDGILHEKNFYNEKFESSIFDITNSGLFQIVPSLSHNGTQDVTTIVLPEIQKECIVILFLYNAVIYCEYIDEYGNSYLTVYQEINTYSSFKIEETTIHDIPYIFIINSGSAYIDSSVNIWKFNHDTKHFVLAQVIYGPNPNSITSIYHNGYHYLAIAYSHLSHAKYDGAIEIRRFHELSQTFVKWQDMRLSAPLQVKFAKLPTQELALYVLTDNPTEPLIIYTYSGISQFQRKITASVISKAFQINSFTITDYRHFILAQNANKTTVIEAVFRGKK